MTKKPKGLACNNNNHDPSLEEYIRYAPDNYGQECIEG